MSLSKKNKSGFTVVEILIVMVIFGIFMVAVYSLYISQLKTTFNRDEMLEVQQNVRIAMERLSKDMRMAGFLTPAPVISGMGNYSTNINMQTASSESTFGSISNVIQDDKFSVTPASVLNDFKSTAPGNKVTIVRPSTRFPYPCKPEDLPVPLGMCNPIVFDVLSSSSGSGRMIVSPAASSVSLRVGDMVCKAPNYPDTIEYRIDRTDTTQNCDKKPCLKRNLEVIAQGIKSIRFEYFFEGTNSSSFIDASKFTTADDVRKITAIRATVVGMTSKTVLTSVPPDATNSRSLTTLIKLRNYKR